MEVIIRDCNASIVVITCPVIRGSAEAIPIIMLGRPEIMTMQDEDGRLNNNVRGSAISESEVKAPEFKRYSVINRVGMTFDKMRTMVEVDSLNDFTNRSIQPEKNGLSFISIILGLLLICCNNTRPVTIPKLVLNKSKHK